MVNTIKRIPKNNYQPSTPLTILSSFHLLIIIWLRIGQQLQDGCSQQPIECVFTETRVTSQEWFGLNISVTLAGERASLN